MVRRSGLRFASCLLASLLIFEGPALAATEVDVALVLGVDISNSMDPEEQALQRDGFVAAFRSPLVHEAIRKGALGRVAVAYMEWAGTVTQQVIVPWTVIENSGEALQFAEHLAASPIRRAPRTSISAAIDFAVLLLEGSGVDAIRRVIDISGDGANNQGRPVTNARNDALERGITINGLPIMLKRGAFWDIDHLNLYYRDCVIGGPGAFIIPVREREQFVEAVKTKLVREMSERAPERLVQPAQAEQRTNCFAGEIATSAGCATEQFGFIRHEKPRPTLHGLPDRTEPRHEYDHAFRRDRAGRAKRPKALVCNR